MRYPIGVLSKLYGFTKEGIRFYEKKGIIKAQRDEHNGYRYYSEMDAQKRGTIKRMQKIGFSLEEANALYAGTSPCQIADIYEEKAELMRREIELKGLVLERLEKDTSRILQAEEALLKFSLCQNEEYVMFTIAEPELLLTDKEMLKNMGAWCDQFILASLAFFVSFTGKSCELGGRGMIIEKRVAEKAGLDISSVNASISAGACIKCIVCWKSGKLNMEEINQKAAAFAAEKKLTLSKRGYIISIMAFFDEKACHCTYGELIIPVLNDRELTL